MGGEYLHFLETYMFHDAFFQGRSKKLRLDLAVSESFTQILISKLVYKLL